MVTQPHVIDAVRYIICPISLLRKNLFSISITPGCGTACEVGGALVIRIYNLPAILFRSSNCFLVAESLLPYCLTQHRSNLILAAINTMKNTINDARIHHQLGMFSLYINCLEGNPTPARL